MDLLDTKILTLFLLLVVTFIIGLATLPLRYFSTFSLKCVYKAQLAAEILLKDFEPLLIS